MNTATVFILNVRCNVKNITQKDTASYGSKFKVWRMQNSL